MNEPIAAKKLPEVKPWVRRVVEAAGVFMPAGCLLCEHLREKGLPAKKR